MITGICLPSSYWATGMIWRPTLQLSYGLPDDLGECPGVNALYAGHPLLRHPGLQAPPTRPVGGRVTRLPHHQATCQVRMTIISWAVTSVINSLREAESVLTTNLVNLVTDFKRPRLEKADTAPGKNVFINPSCGSRPSLAGSRADQLTDPD